jgi:hypothetical protein
MRAQVAEVIDIREPDPERDVLDLIGLLLAVDDEVVAHPPTRFSSGALRVDPFIDLEGSDLLPTLSARRTRLRR